MNESLKVKGKAAFLWESLGKIGNSGTSFIVAMFLSRLLQPEDFGLIAIVLVILGITSIFFDGGFSTALIQRKHILPIHFTSVFYFNLVTALLLTGLLFLSANLISQFYENEKLIPLIKAMSLTFILGALSTVQTVILQKDLNYATLTKITLVSSVVSGLTGILLAFQGFGVWSLIVQNLTMGVVRNVLLWTLSKWKPTLQFSLKAIKSLWRLGFNIFLVSITTTIFSRLDVLIAGKLLSPTIIGFYDRAKHINQMVFSYTAGSLMSVLFPVLSKVQNDLERMQAIVVNIYALLTFITFFLIGISYVNASEIITILFSDKWLDSVKYFEVIIISIFASIYGSLLVNVIISRGNSRLYLKIDIIKKILFLSNTIIGFSISLMFYLYGTILVAIFVYLIDTFYVSKEIKLKQLDFVKSMLIQALIAISAVLIVVFTTKNFQYHYILMLIIKSSIFFICYFLFSSILKTNSWYHVKKEINELLKK
jgi:O-antigen/teichoic acid export membrane protein